MRMYLPRRLFHAILSCFIIPVVSLSQSVSNSYVINQEILIDGAATYYVPITGAPENAVITNVEAKFDYIAYGVVQDYVAVRFNRGSDPGDSAGVLMVPQGSLPAGNPGSYGYVSLSNWNGDSVNADYYFRFRVASGSPFTCTINTIYVKVTYETPFPLPPSLISPGDYGIFNRYSTSSIIHQWTSVDGALEYWLNVFPSGQSASPKFDGTVGLDTIYALSIDGWANGEYIYQVRVRTIDGWSNYSTARKFIADTPPAAPSASTPADGASFSLDSSTTFSWNPPTGVTIHRYYLRVVPGSDLNGVPAIEPEILETAHDVTFFSPPFYVGSYIWGVRAIKVTPPGYDQLTYELTIGWGPYEMNTFEMNGLVGIDDENNSQLPQTIELSQNYPNPFNPSTRIEYTLPSSVQVRLEVFNMLGETVRILRDGIEAAGYHSLIFDAQGLASGLYCYHLKAGDVVITKKLLLIR